MKGYLGETELTDQPIIEPKVGALMFIEMYGAIDGAHHKDWVLDQVARILNGAPIRVRRADWDNGHSELRYSVGTSKQYEDWVKTITDEDCEYDCGITP